MYTVAIAGATGAVGSVMLDILEERDFPVDTLIPLASERSRGKTVEFKGNDIEVEVLSEKSFEDVDLVLSSCGSGVIVDYADRMVDEGAVVVDNSSAYRYDPDIPLVVPEINSHVLEDHDGLIANPNCSTTQLVMALHPLHEAFDIDRIVVSTYQATSGAGSQAQEDMYEQSQQVLDGESVEDTGEFPHQIAFNALPDIGPVLDEENDYTKEEMKMVWETRKILGDDSIDVSPTAVRIPVGVGHGETVNIEFNEPCDVGEVRERLSSFSGVEVQDSPKESVYPTMIDAEGEDPVYVGRIRKDPSLDSGINCWIVNDNLRKGAALNTIQIAETLIEENLVQTRATAGV
ncbi:MAG: aspartate-semialdehyde dehydrogenase [bacterium]